MMVHHHASMLKLQGQQGFGGPDARVTREDSLSPRRPSSKRSRHSSCDEAPSPAGCDVEATPPHRGEHSNDEDDEGEPSTPQVMKKLSKVILAGSHRVPTPNVAAARILEWAGQAQQKLDSVAVEHKKEVPLALIAARGCDRVFKFSQAEAAKVEKLILAFKADVHKATAHLKGGTKTSAQLDVTFREPLLKAKDLSAKVAGIHGSCGPAVDVEWLATSQGQRWKKPGAGAFWAETKGDENLFVLSMNIPMSEKFGNKRALRMSFQLKASSKCLKVKASKKVLLEYAPNLVMCFGQHDFIEVAKSGRIDLSAFWQ